MNINNFAIVLNSGGVLKHKGVVKIQERIFYFYDKDSSLKQIIPAESVKYVTIEDTNEKS